MRMELLGQTATNAPAPEVVAEVDRAASEAAAPQATATRHLYKMETLGQWVEWPQRATHDDMFYRGAATLVTTLTKAEAHVLVAETGAATKRYRKVGSSTTEIWYRPINTQSISPASLIGVKLQEKGILPRYNGEEINLWRDSWAFTLKAPRPFEKWYLRNTLYKHKPLFGKNTTLEDYDIVRVRGKYLNADDWMYSIFLQGSDNLDAMVNLMKAYKAAGFFRLPAPKVLQDRLAHVVKARALREAKYTTEISRYTDLPHLTAALKDQVTRIINRPLGIIASGYRINGKTLDFTPSEKTAVATTLRRGLALAEANLEKLAARKVQLATSTQLAEGIADPYANPFLIRSGVDEEGNPAFTNVAVSKAKQPLNLQSPVSSPLIPHSAYQKAQAEIEKEIITPSAEFGPGGPQTGGETPWGLIIGAAAAAAVLGLGALG